MKNIYDEALKSANHLGNVNARHNGGYSSKHEDNIVKALERAKKVEELLGLYRKHMNTLTKNAREGVKDSMFSSEFVAYELYQQIKALEEEMK